MERTEADGPDPEGVIADPPPELGSPELARQEEVTATSLFDRLRWRLSSTSVESWITFAVVLIAAGAVLWRLHPERILSSTTPTGGDMGAHVWGPAFLRDELLPSFKLRGWSPDWYGGFPAMQFYMVVPYLVIVLLDVILPYGTAFKLVAVSGVVTIPISAWAMGRLARLPFPMPALLSVAGLLYVFDFNFTIYGGNIASTLAGEFAFSISLSLALVYLGLVIRSLDTGRHRLSAAAVLALVALCHLIPLLFAVAATVVIVLVRAIHRLPAVLGKSSAMASILSGTIVIVATWQVTDRALPRLVVLTILLGSLLLVEIRRVWWALSIGLTGALLSSFWTIPFLLRREFLNDMGWEKLDQVRENLFFPDELGGDSAHLSILWLLGLAGLAALIGVAQWSRVTMTWSGLVLVTGFGFVYWPQHRLWNARILPFWFLCLYFLAAFGIWWLVRTFVAERTDHHSGEAGRLVLWVGSVPIDRRRLTSWLTAPLALMSALAFIAVYLGVAPGGAYTDGDYKWGPVTVSSGDRNFVSGWAEWNFSGYEGRTGYPEYFDLVNTLDDVGEQFGCGRALWEYDRDVIGAYGTPMAPMLLPHWTDGCIGSMEGLYFESSPTVPFHFLMQSELSQSPSRPMRGLPYSDLDLDLGTTHLQMSGVRYYMAFSNEALGAASRVGQRLTPIAFSSPWTIYLVEDSELVSPLTHEPAVWADPDHAGRAWTDPAVDWFNDSDQWDVLVTADGPAEWARIDLIDGHTDENGAEAAAQFGPTPRHVVEPVTVTDIDMRGDAISFTVDRIGVPVVVKVSYFPNWSVEGADGPYRATPNWMVVVPTSNEVTLSYGATSVEYLAWILTIIGVVIAAWWLRTRRRVADLDAPVPLPPWLAASPLGDLDADADVVPVSAPSLEP